MKQDILAAVGDKGKSRVRLLPGELSVLCDLGPIRVGATMDRCFVHPDTLQEETGIWEWKSGAAPTKKSILQFEACLNIR